jgi:hypothetical protein
MSADRAATWVADNQRHLMASLAVVRETVAVHLHRDGQWDVEGARAKLAEAEAMMAGPSALAVLSSVFGLSGFETDLLLLCAGGELDHRFVEVLDGPPTFGLALAALPAAHWSAITPSGPLRHWHLLDPVAGQPLVSSPLRIDERILHHLAGADYLDERLGALVESTPTEVDLAPSHQALAERLARAWLEAEGPLPPLELYGRSRAKRSVAAAACRLLGIGVCVLAASSLPSEPRDLEMLIRLAERESRLWSLAVVVDREGAEAQEAAREASVARFIHTLAAPMMVIGRSRMHSSHPGLMSFEVTPAPAGEQRSLWQVHLGERATKANGAVDQLVSQFSLEAHAIRAACDAVRHEDSSGHLGMQLWEAGRAEARFDMGLAERLEPAAHWDDLILPSSQLAMLEEIAIQVGTRFTVYETWGFGRKLGRGLGITALFIGGSGTGKTMAAEVLAQRLRLDLYRIDLSQVVSKYIGETEKNLSRVFDAAEAGAAILLFDEADALFGKRTEVKDSHDRYANIEVGYLLQRMESYRGLAILTTNVKDALDPAFMRRIRFTVQFPFPDEEQRLEIWRRIFPPSTPVQGLDFGRLARLNLAGGSIRNIALNAAFMAAGSGQAVGMDQLMDAAVAEYAKLQKPFTEVRGR